MAATSPQVDITAVEARLLDIVRELLRELGSHETARHVSLDSSFERDLGLGSLERVELLVRCETRFNCRLPDEVAQQAETPAEWVRVLLAGGETAAAESHPPSVERAHPAVERRSYRSRFQIQQPSREAPNAPADATNWIEVLRRHAEVEPDRVHIHLLEEDSGEDIRYGQLLERASEVAAGLVAKGLRPNDTVAIMLPTCADFFYAFFGVMLAGGIAVPIYPPARPDKIEEYVRRQVLILRNAEVRFLISFDKVRTVSQILRVSIPSLIETSSVGSLRQARARVAVEPSSTAFIQYTSGSTGDPKGVVLSQANVLANARGIGWAVKFRPTDVVVSWLPLYHDMGLIGSWLFSVYFGAPITILSPLAFLSRPERWLWALHDSRGTLCPAPNFAYELCARKIPERAIEGLDLSAWRVAINAGEAVLPETLARFEARFAPHGFRAQSFVPCYGLAESSVALTFPPLDRRPVIDCICRDEFEMEGKAQPTTPADSAALRFVANGAPLPDHEIKLVNTEGQKVAERVQGRILFRGLSRTAGYFHNPAATAAAIDRDGWMDSGDLGYWSNGELFVTGRSKDMIIKAGHNILPQEIEAAAGDVPGVRKGCVAAFGMRDAASGTERLVVVAETRATGREERGRVEIEVMRRVNAAVGTPPDKVVLVPPQTIPKTSSGKIRRNQTRLLLESGKLAAGNQPPWVQVMRLWAGNLGSWLGLEADRVGTWSSGAYASALLASVTRATRLLVSLAPGPDAAAAVVRVSARALLFLSGQRVTVGSYRAHIEAHVTYGGSPPPGAVFYANRAGALDPLILAAMIRRPFFFAEASALAGMPPQAAAMLRPLLPPPVEGISTPPGGTGRQRILRALEQGHSIVVLADSPASVPPRLSRFRLDGIHAAVSAGSDLYPIAIRGTSRVLRPNSPAATRAEARILIGNPVQPASDDQRELVELREAVRDAIAEMCR